MSSVRHSHTALARSTSNRPGAATVELVLVLPFLLCVFVAACDFSRIFYFSVIVTNCARNGALYGSSDSSHATDTSGIKAAAQQDANDLTLASLNVTSATDTTTSPTYVDVTVTYPFQTLVNYPGVTQNVTLTRKVRMRIQPLTPLT